MIPTERNLYRPAGSDKGTADGTGSAGSPEDNPAADGPFWREALAPYARPRVGRSVLDVATSAVPYLALSAPCTPRSTSRLLVLALTIPAAGFLVRTFIIFHDCTHGSFLPSRRANAWLGSLGLLVCSPFTAGATSTPSTTPRRATSIAAASATWTKTVAEYVALPRRGRLATACFATRS